MKKIVFFTILTVGLLSAFSANATAPKPPRGYNYVENGHLYVWYNNHYEDMGQYHP
ncbi:MAG: hypothetical protein RL494_737 [Bacteroidota bacterium]|jgi:hypothetical protein